MTPVEPEKETIFVLISKFQHILKVKKHLFTNDITLTKFSGEISVVGDLLTALKLTVWMPS